MANAVPFQAVADEIAEAIGIAPARTSAALGWSKVGVFRWRGPAEEYDIEPLAAPWVILHDGGTPGIRGRVGRHWAPGHSTPGLVTIVPQGKPSGWSVRGDLDAVTVHLGAGLLREVAGDASSLREALRRVEFRFAIADPWLQRLCRELVAELEDPRERGDLYVDRLADVLGLHLLLPPRARERATRTGGLAPQRLRKVRDRLEASVAGGVSLVSLAEVAGLSRFHFARAFRQSTGESPHAYLTRRRLEQARELLHRTDRSLAGIAAETGFASQAHFISAFKKRFGETPGAFRRRR